jgi:hypothetical protein
MSDNEARAETAERMKDGNGSSPAGRLDQLYASQRGVWNFAARMRTLTIGEECPVNSSFLESLMASPVV